MDVVPELEDEAAAVQTPASPRILMAVGGSLRGRRPHGT